MLLCIEMALFSVLHLYAFPWTEYDIHRSHIVASESGPSFHPDKSSYKGGPFGLVALFDAFNPWDLIKAVVRGFRWLFVGRHKREEDVSYRTGGGNGKQTNDAGPTGTAYGASLRTKSGKYHPLTDSDDDQQLLAYAQPNPSALSNVHPPISRSRPDDACRNKDRDLRPMAGNDAMGDIGHASRYRYENEQEIGVIPRAQNHNGDTRYHGASAGPGGYPAAAAAAAGRRAGDRMGQHDPMNRF